MSRQDEFTFGDFTRQVVDDFAANRLKYHNLAQQILGDKAVVHKVALSGSFGAGRARPDSDVDMAVHYSGAMHPEAVADALYGRVIGHGGVFDIHPHREGF